MTRIDDRRPKNHIYILVRGKELASSPKRPEGAWDPSSLTSKGHGKFFLVVKAAGS
jgi:hypothetical protein